jgi:hypothetical protein
MKPSLLAAVPVLAGVLACSSSSSTTGAPQSPSPGSPGSDAGNAQDAGDAASAVPEGGGTGDAAATGDAGDTWASWAQGFFSTYCVECHGAADPVGRDYRQQANVEKEKLEVRCGVASAQDPAWMCAAFPPAKQFPISDSAGTNPKPTDAERARAVAWITAGAP